MSGGDKLSSMDSHGAQPVHISTDDAGDSESIARGMAARATGNEEAFETRASATSATPLSEKGMRRIRGNDLLFRMIVTLFESKEGKSRKTISNGFESRVGRGEGFESIFVLSSCFL